MKKGKLAIIIISGLIGISVIGNILGGSSNKTNNNENSKKQENESAKVEQKAEKTEEQLKTEEEQKKKEEEKLEEKRKLEQKELEEKNRTSVAIGGGATAAAAIGSRNNNKEEVRKQKPAEEKRQEAGQSKVVSRAVQSKEPQVDPNVKEVYITPSGKRYHYDPQCGGKNSYKVGINAVNGRTPCKKCVH